MSSMLMKEATLLVWLSTTGYWYSLPWYTPQGDLARGRMVTGAANTGGTHVQNFLVSRAAWAVSTSSESMAPVSCDQPPPHSAAADALRPRLGDTEAGWLGRTQPADCQFV